MQKIKLNVAVWGYDRVSSLIDGSIVSKDLDLSFTSLWVQEIFARMLKGQEFDVSELSFGAYVQTLSQDEPPFVGIPVFPSRMFRHCSVYTSSVSEIKDPKELDGKKVGVPEYRQTATVWIRGILAEYYGVKINDLEYYTGPLEDDKKVGKYFHNLSNTDTTKLYKNINLNRIKQGQYLSNMIAEGKLDALFSALEPSTFRNGTRVRRMFPNYRDFEKEYFKKTSIFPIMHILVIRRDKYEEYPWIAKELYDMFLEAKNLKLEELQSISGILPYSLPWMFQDLDEIVELMGKDYWPYGFSKNENTVSKFSEYMHDQGIIPKLIKPENMFAKETLYT